MFKNELPGVIIAPARMRGCQIVPCGSDSFCLDRNLQSQFGKAADALRVLKPFCSMRRLRVFGGAWRDSEVANFPQTCFN